MPLGELERRQLIAFFDKKWQERTCPLCQSTTSSWEVHPEIYEFTAYRRVTSVVPAVVIECCNCGHLIFVNAITVLPAHFASQWVVKHD